MGYKNKGRIVWNKEYVIKKDPLDLQKEKLELRKKGVFLLVEKNFSKTDIEFLRLVAGDTANLIFDSNDSSRLRFQKNFNKESKVYQWTDNYFMPVNLKSTKKTSVKKTKTNKEVNYTPTTRNNIGTIRSLMFDIDFHNHPCFNEKIAERLKDSILFFSMEKGVEPTAVVFTGRGIQLHFVFKNPCYMNSKNMTKLIKAFGDSLKHIYQEEVLSHIWNIIPEKREKSKSYNVQKEYDELYNEEIRLDPAINYYNQKARLPGSFNFKSMTYAKVIHLNKNKLYDLGSTLDYLNGDLESIREKQNKKRAVKRRKTSSGRRVGNNGNGKANLANTILGRVDDIALALINVTKKQGEGHRNNAYYSMTWQLLNYNEIYKNNPKSIVAYLKEIDNKISLPYFKSQREIEKFVKDVERAYVKADGRWLTNQAVWSWTSCLQEMDLEYKIFGKKTVTEEREYRRISRLKKEEEEGEVIRNSLRAGKFNARELAEKLKVSKDTVYRRLHKILRELGIQVKRLTKDVLERAQELVKSVERCQLDRIKKHWVAQAKGLAGRIIPRGHSQGGRTSNPNSLQACTFEEDSPERKLKRILQNHHPPPTLLCLFYILLSREVCET